MFQGLTGPIGPPGPAGPNGEKVRRFYFYFICTSLYLSRFL